MTWWDGQPIAGAYAGLWPGQIPSVPQVIAQGEGFYVTICSSHSDVMTFPNFLQWWHNTLSFVQSGMNTCCISLLVCFKRSSAVLVTVSSNSTSICNCFHESAVVKQRLQGCISFWCLHWQASLHLKKSMFNGETLICRLIWSACSNFGAIHFWNVCHSQKLQNDFPNLPYWISSSLKNGCR